uniref:Protein tyrosine kinase n=1 Tax=Suberites domuncula TaxID=55567 RepID=Q50IU8_SUBDO|nr:protein tyrosine kinase [Suberites domuncula]
MESWITFRRPKPGLGGPRNRKQVPFSSKVQSSPHQSASSRHTYPVLGLSDPKVQVIGDLQICKNKKLGSGAFGVVFEGFYRSTSCAVKVLHALATEIQTDLPATGGGQEETLKAFEQECKFLKAFTHKNVVRHFTTKKHPSSGQTMLITELMDSSLRSFISCKKTVITTGIEISICSDIASALEYIHARNVIHRDLCGDNVLIKTSADRSPIAKISDFGMSRLLDPSTMSSTLTALGHRAGYLPPEAPLIDASHYDSSLDIFSFGAIMVQIIQKLETIKTASDRNFHAAQIPNDHPMKPFINSTLRDTKERRPTAVALSHEISRIVRRRARLHYTEAKKLEPVPVVRRQHFTEVEFSDEEEYELAVNTSWSSDLTSEDDEGSDDSSMIFYHNEFEDDDD